MNWAIFYSNNEVFSNNEGGPADAPFVGVIAIVQDWRHPCQVLHRTDFYWWRRDHWCAGDVFGFHDQSARFGVTWLKQGETIYHPTRDVYSEILRNAVLYSKELDNGWRN